MINMGKHNMLYNRETIKEVKQTHMTSIILTETLKRKPSPN